MMRYCGGLKCWKVSAYDGTRDAREGRHQGRLWRQTVFNVKKLVFVVVGEFELLDMVCGFA
jgi:hypothetical protein